MMLVLSLLVVLISLSVHEFAHALVAWLFGDDTAKRLGRLTLNPLKHIDPFGTVLLPLLLAGSSYATGGMVPVFGYAKPVPVNFRNLRPRKLGIILVAFAGPFSNFCIAFVSALMVVKFHWHGFWQNFWILCFSLNLLLAIFNLVPIPPLDGSRIVSGFLPESLAVQYNRMQFLGFLLILLLLQTRFFDQLYRYGLHLFEKMFQAFSGHA